MKVTPRGADFHLHTCYSDGTYTPESLVAAAREKALAVIAVTDHDTFEGVPFVRQAAGDQWPEIVAGVEFSTPTDDVAAEEMHIVGLFLDTGHDELRDTLEHFRRLRHGRALAIIEKLNRAGFRLRPDDVLPLAGHGNISRLHIAKALLNSKQVLTIGEAFTRWIGRNGPCYVPRERPPIDRIIALIHRAGGVAVMAHPGKTNRDAQIPSLVAMGLDGIEVFTGDSSRSDEKRYRQMAEQLGLLISGGSDCHGANKERAPIGQVRLDEATVAALRARAVAHQEKRSHG